MAYALYRFAEYSAVSRTGCFERNSSWEWTYLLVIIPYTASISFPVLEFFLVSRNVSPAGPAAGLLLIIFSAFLKTKAVSSLGHSYSVFIEKPESLVTEGIYSRIRHPEYLSAALLYSACPMMLGSVFSWAVSILSVAALLWRILLEERYLASKFPEYAGYMKKTKALIPFIF